MKVNEDQVIAQERLGEQFAFRLVVGHIEPVHQLCSVLEQCEFADVPDPLFEVLAKKLEEVGQVLREMAGFDPRQGDVPSRQQALVSKLDNTYMELFRAAMPFLNFGGDLGGLAARRTKEIDERIGGRTKHWNNTGERLGRLESEWKSVREGLEQRVDHQLETWRAETNKQLVDARSTRDAVQKVLDDARAKLAELNALAEKAAATKHALVFRTTAAEHSKKAGMWLVTTAITAAATISYLLWAGASFRGIEASGPAAGWSLLGEAVAHLSVLSVGYTSILFSARTYRGHLHNETVNRLKADALSTFQIFADSAASSEVKQAFLLTATQTIFESRTTGFSEREVEFTGHPLASELSKLVSEMPKKKA